MRTFRGFLTGAVVVAAVGFLPSPAAQAAAPSALAARSAPVAPYTALFIDGGPESWRHFGSIVYDSTEGATFAVSATATDQVDFRVDHRGEYWTFRMAPPTGSTWTSGTEYDISLAPSATGAYVDVSYFGQTCDEAPGKLNVRDVVRDGDDALTGFAATFVLSCDESTEDLHGELRWNSDTPYVAATTDPISFPFGRHLVGSGPFTRKVTVTSVGTQPTEFGEVTFTDNSGSYAVTENTCSGTSRAYGETCTITVAANVTRRGTDETILELADNTAAGARSVHFEIVGLDPQAATVSPSELVFEDQVLNEVGTPQRVTVTGNSTNPVTYSLVRIMGNDPSQFVITADTCQGVSLAQGQSCHVEVAAKPTSAGVKRGTLELLPEDGLVAHTEVPLTITSSAANLRGTYTPLRPERILDTRTGNGAPKGLVSAGQTVRLQVAGRGGVPASGVSAVVLNVTVVDTAGNGHVTVYPAGVARPTASSLNFPKDGLRSNSVTVALSASGQAEIHTNTGTHLIADVTGWYAADGAPSGALGGQIQPFEPERIFDSRTAWGEPLPGGAFVQIPMNFRDFNPYIRGFIVNITAVNPTSRGYLTAWDGTGDRPATSTVNYFEGTVTPNFAIVPVGPCNLCEGSYHGVPSISIYSSVTSHVVVDLLGVVDDGSLVDGLRFEPRAPQRIVDSRLGQGVPGKLGGGVTRTVTAPAGVLPPPDTRALALNVTGIAPTANTYLKVWPAGVDRPDASTLNLAAGQTAANAALALLGGDVFNQFNVYNNSGSVDVVVDVVGSFWLYPGTAADAGAKGLGRTGDGNGPVRAGDGGGPGLERAEPGPPALGGVTSPAHRN